MFKYLGDDGEIHSEYYQLIKNAEHKTYEIELKDKIIKGAFKVNYDGESGFAYHVLEGNVFHFMSEKNVISQKIEKEFKQAELNSLSLNDFNIALKDGRNEEKEVELYWVRFFDTNNKLHLKKGYSGKINGEEVFLLKELNKLEYIEKNKCDSIIFIEKMLKLTKEETEEKELKAAKDFLKERNITIKNLDLEENKLNVYNLINQIKSFEGKYGKLTEEEISFEDSKSAYKFIVNVEHSKKEQQNELVFKEKFGFDIEVNLDDKNKNALIKILNQNGRELSALVVQDVFQTSEVERKVLFKKYSDDEDYIKQDIDFVFFDLANENKDIKIYENGKILENIEDSKYFEIYKLFSEYGFSNNIDVGNFEGEVNEVIFEDLELRLESINFNKTDWRNFFTNQYNMSEDASLNELSEKIKNENSGVKNTTRQKI